MKKSFRINSKKVFLTYPQCTATKEMLLADLKLKGDIDAYVVAREMHKDGSFHLHAYVAYVKKLNLHSPKCFDFAGFHGNYQSVRDKHATIRYVSKHNDYISNFDVNAKEESMLKKKRDVSKELLSGRMLHEVTDDHPELLYDYAKLKVNIAMYKLDKHAITSIFPRKCYWIVGKPGIGKSYYVRNLYPDAYIKSQNKWWDGYEQQTVVLLDDLDSDVMGHYLKIWADGYSFCAETKGGTIKPVYTELWVTSNYTPDMLFKDSIMATAVARRFQIKTIDEKWQLIDNF
jgi:hypothetical protein